MIGLKLKGGGMAQKILRNRFAALLALKAERDGRPSITRQEVADYTGISMSTLSRYANNDVEQYADHVILALCTYLECEPGDLLVRVEVKGEAAPEIEAALVVA
jgi:DNA-binding Xre family transcriptional regulator